MADCKLSIAFEVAVATEYAISGDEWVAHSVALRVGWSDNHDCDGDGVVECYREVRINSECVQKMFVSNELRDASGEV